MTSKERMLVAMKNGQPDMVPVAPDISNMIPCKLTGKPFWDIYLYDNPPRWKAYIDAVRHFGFDGWLDNIPFSPALEVNEELENDWKTAMVTQSDERIITREYREQKGRKKWSDYVTVYYRDNPPTRLYARKMGMEELPEKYVSLEPKKETRNHEEILNEINNYMGENGVVGIGIFPPSLANPETGGYSIYDYCDRHKEVKEWALQEEEKRIKILERVLASPVKPDFILTGGSGLLIFNTPATLRDISLPCLQKITAMCKKAGIPSQVHCCGPEKELIKMCAEETDLDSINPLEIPPMGDCNLKEIKENFGKKLSLMGNLHTTEVMLMGSARAVKDAAKKAIDDAAEGGGFILSTGDQCGRDTPEENIFKMIEIARSYGVYT